MLKVSVPKKNLLRWLLCCLHGLLLMIITFLWTNSIYTYGDEVFLVKMVKYYKTRFRRGYVVKIAKENNFLFIDLSYEKSLILPRRWSLGTR